MKTLTFKVNAKNEEEAKQKAENMIGPAMSKMGLNGKGYKFNKVEWLQKSLFESGDGAKAVVYYTVNDSIMKDNKAKIKSYLAQEFRDLKARLSKKNFNDQKSKWIAGLTTIKDALKNFKDSYDIIRKHIKHNGCDISIIETGKGSFRFLVEKDGKKKKSVNVFFSQLEAEDEAKHTAESFNDSAENVEDADLNELGKYISKEDLEYLKSIDFPKTHTKRAQEILNKYVKLKNNADSAINDEIVRRVDYKGCHIYIGKQGSYTYSVYTKNSMSRPLAWDTGYGSESEALEAAKKSADLIVQKFGDSAEYINDRKIDIKRDGKLIDVVNAETLDEAVRIYERQHPELRGQIDAYFSDEAIHDSLSEKAKQLISKAVAEARFDYKTAMDFAVADLKAEKEWAWTNHNEVSQMVQRLIKNRMDF